VWLEIRAKFHLEPYQVLGIVKRLVPTFIAADAQAEIECGWGRKRVRLTQRNLVAAKEILLLVKFVILANHDPAVSLWFAP
jgi:hypothetical protein